VVDDLIRLGRDEDGGYVVSARTIDTADVLVSLGVNDEWSFEDAFCARRPEAGVYAVDGTVSAATFEDRRTTHAFKAVQSALHFRRYLTRHHGEIARKWGRTAREFRRLFDQPGRHFVRSMICDSERLGLARDPERSEITWDQLVGRIDAERVTRTPSKLFVKMDIEGAEYRVLPMMVRDAARITGITIEFHDTDLLWERLYEDVQLLLQQFVVVHAHGNNYMPLNAGSTLPRALEVSFVNRSLVGATELETVNDRTYPLIGLDYPNCPDRADFRLDFSSPQADSLDAAVLTNDRRSI
jgi:hypothetical protein